MRYGRKIAILAAAAVMLAGCGGSTDHTSTAATCLKNALANQAIGGGNNNCADSTAASVEDGGSGTKFNVACTHKNGDEYICDVKLPDNGGINLSGIHGGFYDVTYDTKSIVYQPAQ